MTPATPTLGDVLAPLSSALDLGEGLRGGHAAGTALIAMRIADELGLPEAERAALLDTALLKDAGGPATAAGISTLYRADDRLAKRALQELDLARRGRLLGSALRFSGPRGLASLLGRGGRELQRLVAARDEQGAAIARLVGVETAAEALSALGERWDGTGPRGLAGDEIPLAARIVVVAQTVEIFLARHGLEPALRVAVERSETGFDPAVVCALLTLRCDLELWAALAADDVHDRAARLDPGRPADLDAVALAFARVADSKSAYRLGHSERVAEIAAGVAAELDVDPDTAQDLNRAALLHDLGLLGRSSPLLEKRGPLTDVQIAELRRHPVDTERILRRVPGFGEAAAIAAAHHERLDGAGYPRGLRSEQLPTPARVLALANVFDALTADRPWRPALAVEEALSDLDREAGTLFCPAAFGALEHWVGSTGRASRAAA